MFHMHSAFWLFSFAIATAEAMEATPVAPFATLQVGSLGLREGWPLRLSFHYLLGSPQSNVPSDVESSSSGIVLDGGQHDQMISCELVEFGRTIPGDLKPLVLYIDADGNLIAGSCFVLGPKELRNLLQAGEESGTKNTCYVKVVLSDPKRTSVVTLSSAVARIKAQADRKQKTVIQVHLEELRP
jgi:hypothetical protein